MARLVFLLGPPAVGKSTVLSELARAGLNTVVTRPEDNPYLAEAWSDPSAAYASQRWFVLRIRRMLHENQWRGPIFFEDDPQIAPMLHGQTLCGARLLSEAETSNLAALSLAELSALREGGHSWNWAFLDASVEILLERLHKRGDGFEGEHEWLSSLAVAFRRAAASGGYSTLRTDEQTPVQIAEQIALEGEDQ